MKEALIIILTFFTWDSLGQIVTISIDGRTFEGSGVTSFKFETFDSLLTKKTIKYLDDFGSVYRDSLHRKQSFMIRLIPGLTSEEQHVNRRLASQRLMVVINYLEKTYAIDRSQFKAKFLETMTISCEAFLTSEKHKTRRKNNRS